MYLGQKVKRQGHEAQKNKYVSVYRRKAMLPLAAYVSYVGFSPLQCPAARSMLATSGLPCDTFPLPMLLPMLLPTAGFSVGSFSHYLTAPDLFRLWPVRWKCDQLWPGWDRVENVRYHPLGLALTTTTTEFFAVSQRKKHCRRGSLHSCECWLLLL